MTKSTFESASTLIALVIAMSACGSGNSEPPPVPNEPPPAATSEPPSAQVATPCQNPTCARPEPIDAPSVPLRVKFLGVGGFLVERGDEAVMSAPLYTRPDMITASAGLPVSSDSALVAARLPAASMPNVRAVLSGHAHYDHLLDVPTVLEKAPKATLYANRSARNLMAAYAPDRGPSCAGKPAPAITIPRSRVVAADDAIADNVDYTLCPGQKPAGAPLDGKWMRAPGSHIRVLAVCSTHPDQIGPVHYGAGDVEEEQCTPPTNMNEWKEGRTIAFLVDFLDPKTDKPVYRVFYQDAPTDTPIGHVPPAFLAEKRVDLALMCVGTYDKVDDASPEKALKALDTRYALGGHWEDFFGALDAPTKPIILLNVDAWSTKAVAAMPGWGESRALVKNGQPVPDRALIPQPGDTFGILAVKP